MVTLLQAGSGWTAEALAERFGVSTRRVFNDIRALRDAGVPVRRTRAGYRIDASFFLPSLQLTPHEVLALLFPAEVFNGAEADEEVHRSAREKLVSCLPQGLRTYAEEMLAHTSVALPSSGVNPAVFAEVRQSVAEHRRIAIIYSGRRVEQLRRLEIDPYGVAFRKHAWYVVAWSVPHREVRKFRVSRIAAVERTPLHFTVPKDFSLDEVFEGSWYVFGGEPHEVGIRFGAAVARLVRERKPHPGQLIQTFSDGSLFYRAHVSNLDEVAWWLVQYGGDAAVVFPAELRARVIALASGILRAHGLPVAGTPKPYAAVGVAPDSMVAEGDGGPPPAKG